MNRLRLIRFLVILFCMTPLLINATPQYKDSNLSVRIKARTPHQMAAFYEARGFPQAMIEELNHVCFFTIIVKNNSNKILWHDLSKWRFSSAGNTIVRYDRKYWKAKWQNMKIPMASQSTFRWTLMPERLDFRPQEAEGGNITLPRKPTPFDIQATFGLGTGKPTPLINVTLPDVRCAEDNGDSTP